MVGTHFPQNSRSAASRGKLKMGLFDTHSGILNTQVGDLPLSISMVAFGLAPASSGRIKIVEREP
jgi:hypothetical protein